MRDVNIQIFLHSLWFFSIFRIESADMDGQGRKVVVKNAPHPFGVTIHGSYLYWTDWGLRSVMRADKVTGSGVIVLKDKLNAQPMDIKVYSSLRQNCMSFLV